MSNGRPPRPWAVRSNVQIEGLATTKLERSPEIKNAGYNAIEAWINSILWYEARPAPRHSVIGIPFALQHIKLAGLAFFPYGKEIVPIS